MLRTKMRATVSRTVRVLNVRWVGAGVPGVWFENLKCGACGEPLGRCRRHAFAWIERTGKPDGEPMRVCETCGTEAEQSLETSSIPLTMRQAEILDFIRAYQRENHRPPSIRDIADRFGIESPNGVMCHVKALAAKGEIRYIGKNTARAIESVGGWLSDEDSQILSEHANHPLAALVLKYSGTPA